MSFLYEVRMFMVFPTYVEDRLTRYQVRLKAMVASQTAEEISHIVVI